MTLGVRVTPAALVVAGLICFVFAWHAAAYAGGFRQCGVASWYGYTGRRGANGELYTGREMTAAHKTLPFGTRVRVTDQATGRSVVVRISDRGPYIRGRVIDLSPVARRALGMGGLARVCLDG